MMYYTMEMVENHDFTDEAENYISEGLTNSEEVRKDVISCFKEYEYEEGVPEAYADAMIFEIEKILEKRK